MEELTGLASVDTLDPKLSAEKRVPPVMHLNKLPDMGRMNLRWLWEERRGYSPVSRAAANVPHSCIP